MLTDYCFEETVYVNGEPTLRRFPFEYFVSTKSFDAKRTLGDVERLIEVATGKTKDLWDENIKAQFAKIRRDLLHTANTFERMPKTLLHNGVPIGSITGPEFFSEMLNKGNKGNE